MINIRDATRIHEILIDNFGGTKGIRDIQQLESKSKKYDFVINIASGKLEHGSIVEWLINNSNNLR